MSQPRLEAGALGPIERKRSPWWGVHAARYLFTASYVQHRRVLDIACGTGYGMKILLQVGAQRVVGADVDAETASAARREIEHDNAHVTMANGVSLPFHTHSFGVVTSFETLEHLENRQAFMSEIRRVLDPSGICILSTPNANYTLPTNGKPQNPYHVFEYSPGELLVELHRQFSEVKLLGQVLTRRFKMSPFWEDQKRLPQTLRSQSQVLVWRLINKLPHMLHDSVSRMFWGHEFFPSEEDYEFLPDRIHDAPVLIAVCQG